MSKTNRQYKDTLFRLIFAHREYALELYNAINKTNYTDVENLNVISLEDAMFINVRDDVGYIFHDIMSIFEQQVKFNPNMPMRGLGYISNSLRQYIVDIYQDIKVLHGQTQIRIPTPRYYVLYNGTIDQPEEQILRLSDSYDGEGDIEVTAHMLNINKGRNKRLLEACKPLRDYSELVYRVRKFKAEGLSNEDAVMRASKSCIEDGILSDILRKEMAIVRDILISGITEEEKVRLAEWEKQHAINEAVQSIKAELDDAKAELDGTKAELDETKQALEKACTLAGISVNDLYSDYLK